MKITDLDPATEPTASSARAVVADDPLYRAVQTLPGTGWFVVGEAGGGETALAMILEHRPVLAINDDRIPRLDRRVQAARGDAARAADHRARTGLTLSAERRSATAAVPPWQPRPVRDTVAVCVRQHSRDRGQDAERQDHDQRDESGVENGHDLTSVLVGVVYGTGCSQFPAIVTAGPTGRRSWPRSPDRLLQELPCTGLADVLSGSRA